MLLSTRDYVQRNTCDQTNQPRYLRQETFFDGRTKDELNLYLKKDSVESCVLSEHNPASSTPEANNRLSSQLHNVARLICQIYEDKTPPLTEIFSNTSHYFKIQKSAKEEHNLIKSDDVGAHLTKLVNAHNDHLCTGEAKKSFNA